MLRVAEISIDELETDQWNDLCSKSEVCDAFQTFEWAEVLRNSMDASPGFMIVSEGKESIGGVVYLRKKVFGAVDSYEVRGGPLCYPGKRSLVMGCIIKNFRRRKSSIYQLFVPSPLVNSDFKASFEAEGYHSLPFRTLIINLERPLDDVWRAFDRQARRGVSKAERFKIQVKVADKWQEWEQYYKIHVQHSKQKQYSTDPYNFFQEMFKLRNKNMSQLFIAIYGTKLIAGSLFLVFRENMVFLQNSSLNAFLKYSPNRLIQWKSMEWAKEHGVATYDFNGLPWEGTPYLRGIYEYKRQWDGEVKWQYYYLNRKMLSHAVQFIRMNNSAWKIFTYLRSHGAIPR